MLGWLLWAPLAVARWLLTPIPLSLMALVFAYVYYKYRENADFWTSRGVPGPKKILLFGNEFGPPFYKPILEVEEWLYQKQGGKKFCGYFEFNQPILFVGDLDLIRDITIKNFESFANHREFVMSEEFEDMLSQVNGPKWKQTRTVMSPTFSASKLKSMHQLTMDNASNLSRYLQEQMAEHGEVEMKDSFGKFTIDNIAACAFGVNCDSFNDPNSRFASHASEFINTRFWTIVYISLQMILPQSIGYKLPNPWQKASTFFSNVTNKTIAHRQSHASTSSRNFLELLLETRDKDGNRILSERSITQQSVLFFIAGYDTTATLLTFAAYSLATSPECQKKVQEEIDAVLERHGGQLTYDAVMEMPYLDRVLSETLRLYPPASQTDRESTQDYIIPGTDVHLPKGTQVLISMFQIHRDPDIYPDPLRFDPDRFLPEEKEKRHPCAYLPFGSGPRSCIAMRFALFEAKVALVAVLKEMTLEPTTKTPQSPVPLDGTSFITTPKGKKLHLKATTRVQSG